MTITLHIGQPGNGTAYDPSEPLPYPIHVGDDDRCENVPGYPLRGGADHRGELPILAGFQPSTSRQEVTLYAHQLRENPEAAVGMVPVFFEPGGFSAGMFNLTVLITSVSA